MAKLPSLPAEAPKVESLDDARRVIAELWALNLELLARLGQNSRNSSRPPSSDGPGSGGGKAAGGGAGEGESGTVRRKRGAQPGHKGQRRALVESVDTIVEHAPTGSCACGGAWERAETPYRRHQVFELPAPRIEVTEHRLYRGRCLHCGSTSPAERPAQVPDGQMGPRLLAWIGVLAGRYHLSIRQLQALLVESHGVQFSIGALSQAQGRVSTLLTRTHQALAAAVQGSARVHVDETSHQRAGEARWTWVAVGGDAACFRFLPSRARYCAQHLLGEQPPGVVISDGYGVYRWLPAEQHQLCWAHVVRLLREIAERPGDAGRLGRRLLRLAQTVFRVRHRFERTELPEPRYLRRMQQLRRRLHAALSIGAQLPRSRYAGRCQHLLAHEARLWTFLRAPDIALTNNAAERALRGAVLWRKGSFGVWSHRGEQFRSRILSVVETCRMRGLSALAVVHRIAAAVLAREPYPDVFGIGLVPSSQSG